MIMSQNAKRWIVEFVCCFFGLMVLDDGTFVSILAATFLTLEISLLFLSTNNFFRKFWVPIAAFLLVFLAVSIFEPHFF
ncbi:MAG: hypothetical protein QOD03_810 [Verrucomicrobiota bacterium]|jgi:hypothetical protein